MVGQEEIEVLMLLNGGQHMLLGEQVVFIPQIIKSCGRIATALLVPIPVNIVGVGVNIQQFVQSFLQRGAHSLILSI